MSTSRLKNMFYSFSCTSLALGVPHPHRFKKMLLPGPCQHPKHLGVPPKPPTLTDLPQENSLLQSGGMNSSRMAISSPGSGRDGRRKRSRSSIIYCLFITQKKTCIWAQEKQLFKEQTWKNNPETPWNNHFTSIPCPAALALFLWNVKPQRFIMGSRTPTKPTNPPTFPAAQPPGPW